MVADTYRLYLQILKLIKFYLLSILVVLVKEALENSGTKMNDRKGKITPLFYIM